jgi:hypothetical protein
MKQPKLTTLDAKDLWIEMLALDDIPWNSDPLPRAEEADPLILDDAELFSFALTVREELRAHRLALSVAIEQIRRLTAELHTTREQLARVRDEYRALRVQTMEKAVAA